MAYRLGPTSMRNLDGVQPELVAVVMRAIQITEQDFTVYEGLRSLSRQQQLVRQGYSRTLDSYHRVQAATGYGHAVDLVPWIQGHPVWDWDGCYRIAYAMDLAATQLQVADKITWGAVWDRTLHDFGNERALYRKAVEDYKIRHAGPDFIDGPHFQFKR